MIDILQEIKESNKEQKKITYYKKTLPLVIIFSIIVIIGMVLNNIYTVKQEKHQKKMSSILVRSLNNRKDNPKLMMEGLEYLILSSHNNSIKEVAHIELLGQKIKTNNLEEAKKIATEIINIESYTNITKFYVKLNLLGIIVNTTKNNDNDEVKLLKKLFLEFSSQDVPFWSVAFIYYALWEKKIGNISESIRYLDTIIKSQFASDNAKHQAKILKQSFDID